MTAWACRRSYSRKTRRRRQGANRVIISRFAVAFAQTPETGEPSPTRKRSWTIRVGAAILTDSPLAAFGQVVLPVTYTVGGGAPKKVSELVIANFDTGVIAGAAPANDR